MRNKILVFIDGIAHKNLLQIEAMLTYDFEPCFFVTNYNSAINKTVQDRTTQTLLENNFFKRFFQVNKFLHTYKKTIHHVEVYPGGRFAFIYILLSKIYGLKSICVERGDLLYYNKKGYNKLTRFSMWISYKFCNIIWYRETYMQPILKKINKNIFFLHNAVNIDPHNTFIDPLQKDINFLWLNRVIPQRRYDWFIQILENNLFSNSINYLVGISNNTAYTKEQDYVIKNKTDNLFIEAYNTTPEKFYKRAKFFVLPADIVFANHALLEAMSYGVVPIISDKPGSELIIDNGVNGFIFNHTKNDFESAMINALNVTDEEYYKLSNAAIKKIKTDFSPESYHNGIKELYSLIAT